jgi:predicted aminopeptidase
MRNRLVLALAVLTLVASCAACSPAYVVKAGLAEMRILRARQPIHRVLNDTTADEATRAKLAWVLEARRFASERLGIDVGDSYTMYTELESDTLALVLSAAYPDRLQSKTWWFPVVGRVPYKGFFDYDDAFEAQADLEAEGWDTYVRPTAAFSTLGWFNDPLLSSVLRSDDVEVVQTVFHELSHQYLFVPGRVGFNESFATFVGRVAAIEFFCTRQGGGPDTVRCDRARARWRDYQRFSVFIDSLVAELRAVYQNPSYIAAAKIERRQAVFQEALQRFGDDVQPTLEQFTFQGFRDTPLNNATLLARMRYYHRLPDFASYLQARDGDLTRALLDLRDGVDTVDDPFDLLPRGEATQADRTGQHVPTG